MNSDERKAHAILLKGPPSVQLFAYASVRKHTGWFSSKAAAHSCWTHRKNPIALKIITVRSDEIMALEEAGQHMRAILTPGPYKYPVLEYTSRENFPPA